MRGLIIAAVAAAAGVAGVVGLSAAVDDGPPPAPAAAAAAPTSRPEALADRLALVRRAERAADAAVARAAAAQPPLQLRGDGSVDGAQPAAVTPSGGDGDDHSEDGGGRGRGRGGDDHWDDD